MASRPTLITPPPLNPDKSAIENVLELTELAAIAPVRTENPPFANEEADLRHRTSSQTLARYGTLPEQEVYMAAQ